MSQSDFRPRTPALVTSASLFLLPAHLILWGCTAPAGNPARASVEWDDADEISAVRSGPSATEADSVSPAAVIGSVEPAQKPALGVTVDDVNDTNNPLNPAVTWALQDFYVPELSNTDAYTNDLFGRVTLPIAPGSVVAVGQIVRASMPITTRPDPDGGYSTGFGDFSIFDLFMLGNTDAFEFGVGPLLVLPTASEDELGKGKVQLGIAASAIRESPRGLHGALVQWATDVAGEDDRDDVSFLQLQPIFTHNLDGAWYLRSTATWGINWDSGDYYVPIGVGIGKVVRSGTTLFNFYVEPQFTIIHDGDGQPEVTLLFGMTTTLGK